MNDTEKFNSTTGTALVKAWRTVVDEIDNAASMRPQDMQNKPTLVAVSKTKPASMVASLAKVGQQNFGENYLQEALTKIQAVNDLLAENQAPRTIIWHYIGHIQRNKTRDIANNFDWVQTIERRIIAKRLNDQRDADKPKLKVLIQVNIDDEDTKSGCLPDEVENLVSQIMTFERLALRGLMVIPAKTQEGTNTKAFERTKTLFDNIASRYPALEQWDTLSMGMSDDVVDAIEYGSTMVRVGSAIFGERE